eukprot:1174007-Amphidinium_carterae.1
MNGSRLCPYHAAVSQTDVLHRMFGKSGKLPDELPLFPDKSGRHVAKGRVIASIRAMLPEDEGVEVTGHTFRVTGARLLASRG